jgi:hypothetical protein
MQASVWAPKGSCRVFDSLLDEQGADAMSLRDEGKDVILCQNVEMRGTSVVAASAGTAVKGEVATVDGSVLRGGATEWMPSGSTGLTMGCGEVTNSLIAAETALVQANSGPPCASQFIGNNLLFGHSRIGSARTMDNEFVGPGQLLFLGFVPGACLGGSACGRDPMTGMVVRGNAFVHTSADPQIVQTLWRNAQNLPWLGTHDILFEDASTWFGSPLNQASSNTLEEVDVLNRRYSTAERDPTVIGHQFHHLPNLTYVGAVLGPEHAAIPFDLDGKARDPNHLTAGPYAFGNTK